MIKKFPHQLLFYNATSLSLSAIGKNEEALKLLSQALSQNNNDIYVLNNLGLINGNLNKNKQAREYYKKALSINENFIDQTQKVNEIMKNTGFKLREKKQVEQSVKGTVFEKSYNCIFDRV